MRPGRLYGIGPPLSAATLSGPVWSQSNRESAMALAVAARRGFRGGGWLLARRGRLFVRC